MLVPALWYLRLKIGSFPGKCYEDAEARPRVTSVTLKKSVGIPRRGGINGMAGFSAVGAPYRHIE
jgi:hypothetical protein